MNDLASMAAQKQLESGEYQRLTNFDPKTQQYSEYQKPHLFRRESMPAQPSNYHKPQIRRESMPTQGVDYVRPAGKRDTMPPMSEYQQPHIHKQLMRQVPPPTGQQENKPTKKCHRSVSMSAAQVCPLHPSYRNKIC